MHTGFTGLNMGFMVIWWFAGIAFLVWLGWLILNPSRPRTGSSKDTPETVLKYRYARGEIDRDEFLDKLNELAS